MLLVLPVLAAPCLLAAQESFVDARRMLPEIGVSAASIGDLDGDGDSDVLIAGFGHPVRILRNDGSGLLELDGETPADGNGVGELLIEDLDGDGDADFVALGQNGVRIYRNDAGTFHLATDLGGAPGASADGALGDLDGDGDSDLFVVYSGGQQNAVYRNLGNLAFGSATGSALPSIADWSLDVELGDLDGDGNLDALVACYPPMAHPDYILWGKSGIKFDSQPTLLASKSTELALADLDADADLDAFLCDSTALAPDSIAWNDGAGTFTLTTAPGGTNSHCVLLDDIDGDSVIDILAAATSGGPVEALLGQGGGAFLEATDATFVNPANVSALLFEDLDGDSDKDLIGLPDRLWLNDGGSYLEAQRWVSGVHQAYSIADLAAGDVDGDGYDDILAATSSTAASPNDLYLGGPEGAFVRASDQLPPVVGPSTKAALVDLDSDGDLDAVLGNSSEVSFLHKNDGFGTFTDDPASVPASFHHVQDLAHGDVDGDGDEDFVSVSWIWNPSGTVYANDGTGALTDGQTFHIDNAYRAVAMFDADQDGDLDLLLSGIPTHYWENDGTGSFTESASITPFGFIDLESGDLDQDGDDDIVMLSAGGGQESRTLRNDGGGAFTLTNDWVIAAHQNFELTLEDVDGDLDLDILHSGVATFGGSIQNAIYRNDGSGTYGAAEFLSDADARHPVFLDLDLDGDRDMISASMQVTVNTTGGQLTRVTVPRVGKPLTLEVFGEAGSVWTLAFSGQTASIPIPGFGELLLNPATLNVAAAGVMPTSSEDRIVLPVPNDPLLVGATAYWQALLGSSPTLSNREATTFTSY